MGGKRGLRIQGGFQLEMKALQERQNYKELAREGGCCVEMENFSVRETEECRRDSIMGIKEMLVANS